MSKEGDSTLKIAGIIGAIVVCVIVGGAIGIGSNPPNPQLNQLSTEAADVTNPEIAKGIATINAKIDGCADLVSNKTYLQDLQTQVTDEASFAKTIDTTAKSPADAQARKDKVHDLSTSAAGSIRQLLALIDTCTGKRDASADTKVTNLWTSTKKNITDLRSVVGYGSVLNVPGVSEGSQGDCGGASLSMVMLYYLTDHGTNSISYADLGGLKDELEQIPTNLQATSGQFGTIRGDQCLVDVAVINDARNSPNGNLIPSDFARANVNNIDQFQAAIKSIKAGDPVIIYTAPGGWYRARTTKSGKLVGNHIYVLVGYDDATKEFTVNNPYPNGTKGGYGGVNVKAKGPTFNAPAQTVQHLFEKRGDVFEQYKHTFVIRKTYCTGDMNCIPF